MKGRDHFNKCVEDNLRNQSTPKQDLFLYTDPQRWLNELLMMKRRTETQMSSSKSRSFNCHVDYAQGVLTKDEFHACVQEEKSWRVNANRFIQQIEMKLIEVKSHVKQHNSNKDQKLSNNA